jgi:hypothetical protein
MAVILPSTSCSSCLHFVRIVVYSAAGVRPSLSQTQSFRRRVSGRVSGVCCYCVRASVPKQFLVLHASVLKNLRVAYFPPFEADEGYGVSVLVSELSCLMCAQTLAVHLYHFTPSIYFCTLPLTSTERSSPHPFPGWHYVTQQKRLEPCKWVRWVV